MTTDRRPGGKSAADIALEERVSFGGGLHDNFQQQIELIMADADLSEEDRQNILANLNCPCCGGNAMSFTIKLVGER